MVAGRTGLSSARLDGLSVLAARWPDMLATALTLAALDCAALAAGVARLLRAGDGAAAPIPAGLLVVGAGLLGLAKAAT